ncbi:c-type cytochrome biogenesis protein CcsB [Bacillus ndiopicus]|uniref:c-type cytochrome biogenesis protein CcsB n=1 Tax=Bacillus ndiopicus TaxID=1347368 RepID=UPI0005A8D96F|nr:c-type cytochrome biogenesis protein CcsB [Bacillus ndiopicus]
MNNEQYFSISSNALLLAFILLLIAIVPFGFATKSRHTVSWKSALALTWIAFILQIIYFVCRWKAVGHAPVSNMYEFMTFFGIMLIGAVLLISYLYKQWSIGFFALPIALIVLGYGSVFTNKAAPLIPSLQSNWLAVHVITVAASSAVLSVAFVTGLMYLLKTATTKTRSTKWLELVLFNLIVVVGFILISTLCHLFFSPQTVEFINKGGQTTVATYTLPIIISNDTEVGIIKLTTSINAKKLNTIVWSFLVGIVLYLIIRYTTRKTLCEILKPFTLRMDLRLLDEISHRAILIGFPLFSLGGLFFAMIWAQIAWGRYWGWDPKEVWALITWLFYAALLHLRLTKEWEGERTAWLAIIGFGLIVFNQVFVNLVIAGLHSYA